MKKNHMSGTWACLAWSLVLLLMLSMTAKGDLLLRYPLDEGSGLDVLDVSGNENHALMNNMDDSAWVAGKEAKFGTCLSFDGTDDYVKTVDVLSEVLDGDLTMSLWFNAGPGQNVRVFSLNLENQLMLNVRIQNDFIGLDDSGGTVATSTTWGTVAISDNAWHHFAMVRDGSLIIMYLDGELMAEAPLASIESMDNLTIGARTVNSGAQNFWLSGQLDEVSLYNEALDIDTIRVLMDRLVLNAESASSPSPADGAVDVVRDLTLSWTPGVFAESHHVYLDVDLSDVENATEDNGMGALVGFYLDANSLQLERLDLGQTYYWRVDEVNSPANPGLYKGDIWSFTVESLAYPVTPVEATASSNFMPTMGPENTINGSGLNDMDQHSITGTEMWLTASTDTERWIQYMFDKPQKLHEMLVWNSNQAVETFIGFGLKTVTIETSLDGSTWTALTDVPEFAQAPGTADYTYNTTVAFGGVTAQYVKLTVNSGYGFLPTPQFGLSEVRFLAIPVYAGQPQPANGTTAGSVDVTLAWRAGREADTHEVVLSSDRADVEAGTAVVGNPTANSFTPAMLRYGTEYFWAINEVNNVAETPRYEGDIWSFKAPEYLVLDDFELYADKEFLEIWAFWADGYQDDNNGAIVGNGNAGDTNVVYQGRQSMPIHYDNNGAAISEVTRTFSPLLDWNKGAPTTLSLHVRGDAPAFIDGGDTLTVGGSGGDIWGVADEFRFVYKTLNGNGSITAKVESLTHVHDWAKAGVMIRETLTAESTCAYTVATGASGVTFQYRTTAFNNAASDSSTRDTAWADQEEPVWVRVERSGDDFNGYISLDGVTWMPSVSNPQTITMLPEVKIGFCVTSHDNSQSSTAVFSNVSTTGSVSGGWAVEAFGEGHPDNDAAPMYLVVTDANGREKTFSHPDADVSVSTNWAPWQIPLNDMGSVNLGSIEKITIGVGTPGGSAGGAQGTVYVDLLQVGTPLPSTE